MIHRNTTLNLEYLLLLFIDLLLSLSLSLVIKIDNNNGNAKDFHPVLKIETKIEIN